MVEDCGRFWTRFARGFKISGVLALKDGRAVVFFDVHPLGAGVSGVAVRRITTADPFPEHRQTRRQAAG